MDLKSWGEVNLWRFLSIFLSPGSWKVGFESALNVVCIRMYTYHKCHGYMTISNALFILVAPKIVIYDNACNLHAYALNRNPQHFKGTVFFVDRFHWDNHSSELIADHACWLQLQGTRWVCLLYIGTDTDCLPLVCYNYICSGCSQGYHIRLYGDHQSVNTEVVEQANSDLCKLKSSLSYMNKCNFISYLKLFLYYRNKKYLHAWVYT